MEETLGKRISARRKALGMTQDRLAEFLGVTAQAVSKWENDQSCPDITTLPKLAEIFSTTTDHLLGLEQEQVHMAEVVKEPADQEPEDAHVSNGNFEFQWDGGRKGSVGLALWVLVSGGLLFASNHFQWNVESFHILWTSGLTLFGLFGIWPCFSFLRLCCALLGGYFLVNEIIPIGIGKGYLLPVFLILFGLSLLAKALKRPKHGRFHVTRNGKTVSGTTGNHCACDDTSFSCETSFGQHTCPVPAKCLERGSAAVCFGELTLDLWDCETAVPECRLDLNCAFGQLSLLVPRRFRVEPACDTSFGSVDVQGQPAPDAIPILAECDASFGQITIRYI